MKRQVILIVEDEVALSTILRFNLEKEGYEIITAFDGEEAVELEIKHNPDLVLLDIMLPKKNGFEVCKEIRSRSKIPIIMLTAKDEEVDTILGLELGADDYMTKPYKIRELIARVKANLRRVGLENKKEEEELVVYGDLSIDFLKYEVFLKGQNVNLTFREFELLKFFIANPGRVIGREEILRSVWEYDYFGDVRTVDVTIRRLREKIEKDSSKPKYILTRRNVGYFFQPQETQ